MRPVCVTPHFYDADGRFSFIDNVDCFTGSVSYAQPEKGILFIVHYMM